MAELGALSLRISEQGGEAVLSKLKAIDGAAKLTSQSATPLSQYFKRAGADASSGLGKATAASKALNKEIADGTRLFALNARTVDVTSKAAVSELRATAAAQREWLVSVGASTEQQERFNASVQRFEQRVARGGVAVAATTPKFRSGASALAALTIAATTGGGSLAGMATQAGLVGSVMASEFAPAKWAGYAAGIGAAVVAITALVGIIAKLHAEASKPRELITGHIDAIRLRSLAEDEAARRRKALDEARERQSNLPPGLTVETIRNQLRAKAELNRAEAEFAAANKKLADLTGDAIKDGAEVTKQAIVQAAEATRTVRLSELAKDQASVEAQFAEGNATLAQQYDERRRVILEGAKLERAALEAARAQKLKAIPGETEAEAGTRQLEARQIQTEITALANATAARLTALDQQRAADERALTAKVLGYQIQLEQFSDTAFQKRMEQINAEDAERRRALAQRGNATQQELADLDALTEKQKAHLFLQKAQADLSRLREDLTLRIAEVENRRLAGLLDEEEASREIADIQRSALPTMQEAVNRAIEWAEKMGDQGVLGALKAIKAELAQPILLNIDIQTDLITKRLNKAIERIQGEVNSKVLSEAEGRKLVAQEKFGAGFAGALSESIAQGAGAALQGKNPLQALGQALSSSFGSLLVDVGTHWLKASLIMAKLQAFFVANPLAAAGAAAALIVFGTAIGGRSGGGGGGGVGGGGSTAPTPISISRLIVDPNAGVRQRIASAGQQSVTGPATHPLAGVALLAVDKPQGAEYLALRVASYQGRGG
jgi:hypothetical protein